MELFRLSVESCRDSTVGIPASSNLLNVDVRLNRLLRTRTSPTIGIFNNVWSRSLAPRGVRTATTVMNVEAPRVAKMCRL